MGRQSVHIGNPGGQHPGQASPERAEKKGMDSPSAPPGETILIVDDDLEVLALAADILREAGYAVLSTEDPREALQLARNSTEPLHLLLTDVRMPLMSGGQLAEELRSIRPDVKVLFMSGYWESLEDYQIRLAPGEPFLDKPFTIAALEGTVRAALVYRPPLAKAGCPVTPTIRPNARDSPRELAADRQGLQQFTTPRHRQLLFGSRG
jgi:CheY-like chemotaxis protein